jgi:hypothetical protein
VFVEVSDMIERSVGVRVFVIEHSRVFVIEYSRVFIANEHAIRIYEWIDVRVLLLKTKCVLK